MGFIKKLLQNHYKRKFSKLRVGRGPKSCSGYFTNPQLRYFEQYGKIKYCQVKLDPTTGTSRGFGFILYEQTDSVDNVIKNLPHTGNPFRLRL